ncbi:hypothetical protein ACLMJK_003974 [Lecanora helva]
MSLHNTNLDILVAGAFAAFTVDLLIYPLDTIKTRLQSPDYIRLYTHPSTHSLNRSLFHGLYQGIGSVILATIPSSGAFFTTYEATKTTLTHHTPLPRPIAHALASSAGELVSCLILTPAEVLKQNAQMVTHTPHPSPSKNKLFDGNATIQALRKFNSPTQLWRGYTALAGRNLPFTAMQFPMFEHLRTWIHESRRRNGVSTGSLWETGSVTALSAGSAGAVAAVVTTPIDVVKTRIMLSAADVEQPRGEEQRKVIRELEASGKDAAVEIQKAQQAARGGRAGGVAVGREILRAEGLRGLFRGGALRGLWTALGSGLYLGVYESGRRYLEGRRTGMREGDSL